MQDLNDLYYFVQVVEHGGFAPAGRALGLAKSKLSRRIAQLEERLNARLIHRSRAALLRTLQSDVGGSASGSGSDRQRAGRAPRSGAYDLSRWASELSCGGDAGQIHGAVPSSIGSP